MSPSSRYISPRNSFEVAQNDTVVNNGSGGDGSSLKPGECKEKDPARRGDDDTDEEEEEEEATARSLLRLRLRWACTRDSLSHPKLADVDGDEDGGGDDGGSAGSAAAAAGRATATPLTGGGGGGGG